MLAVDMSNYTDPLTAASVQRLKDAGVGHVIVQAVDPPPGYPAGKTRAQIQACLDAGLTVDAYVWLWFDLDVADINRKLGLLQGLSLRQLWLDVEDTAASKYDQAATEAKVSAALAACDQFTVLSGAPTGVYSGRWFWLDRRYMGNTTMFAARELWDANYDDVVDAARGFATYGGWQGCAIKQFRGSCSVAGVGGLDLNVLSAQKEATLTAPATNPAGRGEGPAHPDQPAPDPDQPPAPVDRETPADWLWPTWFEAAVQYRAIADQLGQQLATARPTPTGGRETPDNWQWPTWYEAAIQYQAIADQLGQQIAAIRAVLDSTGPTPPASA